MESMKEKYRVEELPPLNLKITDNPEELRSHAIEHLKDAEKLINEELERE